ncbi:hypothetical protein [Methanobrevibacter sp.]|uniref:hypothetical protein n=1 Tax=Methanobrevibacter sp. TaxID=66852 RepID=UPI0038902A90
MLTPVGSAYVTTDSLPSYGDMGGYVLLENAGKYLNEVFSICVSTTQGESHPPEVILYDPVGDITVYKDNQGNDAYYIVRHVGEYRFSLIGNDVKTMINMLNSIEITT